MTIDRRPGVGGCGPALTDWREWGMPPMSWLWSFEKTQMKHHSCMFHSNRSGLAMFNNHMTINNYAPFAPSRGTESIEAHGRATKFFEGSPSRAAVSGAERPRGAGGSVSPQSHRQEHGRLSPFVGQFGSGGSNWSLCHVNPPALLSRSPLSSLRRTAPTQRPLARSAARMVKKQATSHRPSWWLFMKFQTWIAFEKQLPG